jgi:hypothetical protein
MEQHKLLQKQIKKFLTDDCLDNPLLKNFINAVNEIKTERSIAYLLPEHIKRISHTYRDFNDVVLNVAESGFKAGNSSQLVPLKVEFGSRDADYLNEVGYYLVDDIKGTINGVSPDDPNYSQEVFKQGNYQVVFEPDNYGGSREYTLKGGQYIGWYLISNSSSKKYLETNPTNDPNGNLVAYFSYASANPDDLNHFIY